MDPTEAFIKGMEYRLGMYLQENVAFKEENFKLKAQMAELQAKEDSRLESMEKKLRELEWENSRLKSLWINSFNDFYREFIAQPEVFVEQQRSVSPLTQLKAAYKPSFKPHEPSTPLQPPEEIAPAAVVQRAPLFKPTEETQETPNSVLPRLEMPTTTAAAPTAVPIFIPVPDHASIDPLNVRKLSQSAWISQTHFHAQLRRFGTQYPSPSSDEADTFVVPFVDANYGVVKNMGGANINQMTMAFLINYKISAKYFREWRTRVNKRFVYININCYRSTRERAITELMVEISQTLSEHGSPKDFYGTHGMIDRADLIAWYRVHFEELTKDGKINVSGLSNLSTKIKSRVRVGLFPGSVLTLDSIQKVDDTPELTEEELSSSSVTRLEATPDRKRKLDEGPSDDTKRPKGSD
jgi:regulator of replication initiation timing